MTATDSSGLVIVPKTVPSPTVVTGVVVPIARPRKARHGHRGVYLIAPDPPRNRRWRVRWRDPETRKLKVRSLTDGEAKTAETREACAVALHKALARRRDEIRGGASPHTAADVLIEDAIREYFEAWGSRRRERTRENYRHASNLLQRWCGEQGIKRVRQLDKRTLARFAASRVALKQRNGKPRAASTINFELRCVAAVLQRLRDADALRLGREDVASALKRLDEEREKREFLRPAALRTIIEACIAFDVAENERALPLVLFLLLTGLRVSEALQIEWSDVHDGAIHVPASKAMTKIARTIDLEISPLLTALLGEPSGRVGVVLADYSHDRAAIALQLRDVPYVCAGDFRRRVGVHERAPPRALCDDR
jgi:integrase